MLHSLSGGKLLQGQYPRLRARLIAAHTGTDTIEGVELVLSGGPLRYGEVIPTHFVPLKQVPAVMTPEAFPFPVRLTDQLVPQDQNLCLHVCGQGSEVPAVELTKNMNAGIFTAYPACEGDACAFGGVHNV